MKRWMGWLLRKDLRGHASVSEALKASREARMKPAGAKPEPKYEVIRKQVYMNGPWVSDRLSEGFEIVAATPVIIAGNTLNQHVVVMRRPNPRYVAPREDAA